jgi:hypothetical protein
VHGTSPPAGGGGDPPPGSRRRLERRTSSLPGGARSWLRAAIGGPFKASGPSSSERSLSMLFEVRIHAGGARWAVTRSYKAFLTADAQLRGAAEPSVRPPLGGPGSATPLPELPQARGAADARAQAARLAALQAWVPAVLGAIRSGSLTAHPPLAALLDLPLPLLVRLQAAARTLVARRRYVAALAARTPAVPA